MRCPAPSRRSSLAPCILPRPDAPPACPSNLCSQVKDQQLAELRKQLEAALATIAVSWHCKCLQHFAL